LIINVDSSTCFYHVGKHAGGIGFLSKFILQVHSAVQSFFGDSSIQQEWHPDNFWLALIGMGIEVILHRRFYSTFTDVTPWAYHVRINLNLERSHCLLDLGSPHGSAGAVKMENSIPAPDYFYMNGRMPAIRGRGSRFRVVIRFSANSRDAMRF